MALWSNHDESDVELWQLQVYKSTPEWRLLRHCAHNGSELETRCRIHTSMMSGFPSRIALAKSPSSPAGRHSFNTSSMQQVDTTGPWNHSEDCPGPDTTAFATAGLCSFAGSEAGHTFPNDSAFCGKLRDQVLRTPPGSGPHGNRVHHCLCAGSKELVHHVRLQQRDCVTHFIERAWSGQQTEEWHTLVRVSRETVEQQVVTTGCCLKTTEGMRKLVEVAVYGSMTAVSSSITN